MKKQKKSGQGLSDSERRLIEGLRQRPQLMERFQSILELANSEEGPLLTADEVEELLIEEVRKLGNETMTQWAVTAEERVAGEIKEQDEGLRSRKKKR